MLTAHANAGSFIGGNFELLVGTVNLFFSRKGGMLRRTLGIAWSGQLRLMWLCGPSSKACLADKCSAIF